VAEFSKIKALNRIPLQIRVLPWMLDHRFEDRAVLPAVESMQVLAESTLRHIPGMAVDVIADAVFPRFLPLSESGTVINAVNVIQLLTDGSVSTSLQTKQKKKNITRNFEHVSCRFCVGIDKPNPPVREFNDIRNSGSFQVTPAKLYRELVPFGEAFRNVRKNVILSGKGATADIRAGRPGKTSVLPLGSTFILDAAFHAACVWSQRYTGIVAFPVAIRRRYIFKPASSNRCFSTIVIPRQYTQKEEQPLSFDIWILDSEELPVEAAIGVVMKDVSAGRWKAPQWVRSHRPLRKDVGPS